MIELLFIRHGATAGNLRRRYIGRTDEPLCEAGVAQVETLRKQGRSVDKLFVARCCARGRRRNCCSRRCPIPSWTALPETDFGRFEGKSADELSDDPTYQAWVDAMCLTPIPKGESVVGFKTRCCWRCRACSAGSAA